MTKMTDKELLDLCQKYGSNARRWKRKFAALLPEVERRGLWKKHGFCSIVHFAKVVGGVGESTVKSVLSTYRRVEDKPKLKAEIEKQGYAKVRAVASLPIEKEKLVEMVQKLPMSTLEKYRKGIKKQESQKINDYFPEPDTTLRIDKSTEFRLKKFQQKLEKEQKRAITLKETLNILLDQVEEPKKQPRKEAVKKESHYISAEKKYKSYNNGQCQFPGCNKPHTCYHHPDRYAKTKNHNRIVPLCHEHHRLAHAGLIENEHAPPDQWQLRTEMQPNEIDKKYLQHAMFGEP